MIYLDNAATTRMSDAAKDAFLYVIDNEYGNPSSIYKYGRNAKKIVEEARNIIANCIGAYPDEIVFTSGGTESNNWVINTCSAHLGSIVTTSIEHHAILNPTKKMAMSGIKCNELPVDYNCLVSGDSLKSILGKMPTLVSVMYQNNETGTVQPIKELANIVHNKNSDSIFHTDAVQAIGHQKINVHSLDIDLLSASAHKFNGPKGIGFLYIKRGCKIPPFILGGSQEAGLRAGTENTASIYAMAKALEDNYNNYDETAKRIADLDQYLINKLDSSGITYAINADNDQRARGILNISFSGIDAEGLLNILDLHDICVSIGSACNSEAKERSHVLRAMHLSNEIIDSSIRISIGRYNTKEDIDVLVEHIKRRSMLMY